MQVRGRQPIPAPATPSLDALRAGAFDSQLVSVSGVIRARLVRREAPVLRDADRRAGALRPGAGVLRPGARAPGRQRRHRAGGGRGHHQQPPADDQRAAVRADAGAHPRRLAGARRSVSHHAVADRSAAPLRLAGAGRTPHARRRQRRPGARQPRLPERRHRRPRSADRGGHRRARRRRRRRGRLPRHRRRLRLDLRGRADPADRPRGAGRAADAESGPHRQRRRRRAAGGRSTRASWSGCRTPYGPMPVPDATGTVPPAADRSLDAQTTPEALAPLAASSEPRVRSICNLLNSRPGGIQRRPAPSSSCRSDGRLGESEPPAGRAASGPLAARWASSASSPAASSWPWPRRLFLASASPRRRTTCCSAKEAAERRAAPRASSSPT